MIRKSLIITIIIAFVFSLVPVISSLAADKDSMENEMMNTVTPPEDIASDEPQVAAYTAYNDALLLPREVMRESDPDNVHAAVSSITLKNSAPAMYETEPNYPISNANKVYPEYNVFGTITSNYYDLDYYKFTVSQESDLTIIACWCGDYANLGWEDDLAVGMCDSNGDVYLWSKYVNYGGGVAAQVIEGHAKPGTYAMVVFQSSDYKYLYVNKWYGFNIGLTSTNTDVSVTGVTLDKSSLTMKKGAAAKLIATVLPATAMNKSVTWTSSNPSIASTDQSGNITGNAAGQATITVTTQDGSKTASCLVTVQADTVAASSVVVTPDLLELGVGETGYLTAAVYPANASNRSVYWNSNNTSVATVDSTGKVTAVSAGYASITATSVDGGYTDTSTVKVADTVTLSRLSISPATMVLAVGSTGTFKVTATYNDGTTEDVTADCWYDYDEKIIEVYDDGTVDAIASGTTVLTAGYGDLEITANITSNIKQVKKITVTPKVVKKLSVGDFIEFQVIAKYADKTSGDVTSLCSLTGYDANIIDVDEGIITGLLKGKTSMKIEYGGKKVTLKITVAQ